MTKLSSLVTILKEWPICDIGSADDAAMDLSEYDEPEAEDALTSILLCAKAPDIILYSCAESLAEIWCRTGRFNRTTYLAIPYLQKKTAESIILFNSPALLSEV